MIPLVTGSPPGPGTGIKIRPIKVTNPPEIIIIPRDPFIVYTSNVFASLGLRALYFALARIMGLFHHLHGFSRLYSKRFGSFNYCLAAMA